MNEILLKTQNDWIGFLLRITAGLVMLPHGMQKLFGAFGGYGFAQTMNFFTSTLKLPWIVAFLVVVVEFVGPLGLIVGAFSKVWAFALAIIMIGAIVTTNFQNGLFMNWNGNQSGEGYEFHLLYICICISILLVGSGKYSVDLMISSTE